MFVYQFAGKILSKNDWLLLWKTGYSSLLVVMTVVPVWHYIFMFLIYSQFLRGKCSLRFATILKILLKSQHFFHPWVKLLQGRLMYSWSGTVKGEEIRLTELSVSLLLVAFNSIQVNQYCSLHSWDILFWSKIKVVTVQNDLLTSVFQIIVQLTQTFYFYVKL